MRFWSGLPNDFPQTRNGFASAAKAVIGYMLCNDISNVKLRQTNRASKQTFRCRLATRHYYFQRINQ